MFTRGRKRAIEVANSVDPETHHVLWCAGNAGNRWYPMTVPKSASADQLIRRMLEASNESSSAIGASRPDNETIKNLKVKAELLKTLHSGMPIDAAFNAAAALARTALGATGAASQANYSSTADPADNRQTPSKQQPVASSSKTGDKNISLNVISPQCCLCEKVPRIHEDESIYISQCDNGHILCQECNQQLIECPICRSKSKARNRFAEKYVRKYYSRTPTNCSHLTCPASLTMSAGELLLHEKYCVHQEVHSMLTLRALQQAL
jgi:hypothetical protein